MTKIEIVVLVLVGLFLLGMFVYVAFYGIPARKKNVEQWNSFYENHILPNYKECEKHSSEPYVAYCTRADCEEVIIKPVQGKLIEETFGRRNFNCVKDLNEVGAS